MSGPAPIIAHATRITVVGLAVLATGCGRRQAPDAKTDHAHVERDVRALLDRWIRSFESRDEIAVRSILADDERFAWLEDGEIRYRSVDDVVAALDGFPPGVRFSHELTSARIVPVSDDAAWAQLATTTAIRQGEHVLSEFPGVVLMLLQRDDTEWRIIAAHTSTTKPRTPGPG